MKKNDDYYMRIALKEAIKAYEKDEIPVGAVLYSIEQDKIIAKAYNKRDKNNIVIDHAEILVIRKANKKNNNWRLPSTILYTTLEPCDMCKEVIKEAKIEKVIYGAVGKNNIRRDNYHQIDNIDIIKECEILIKTKFEEIRNNH